MRGRHQKIKAEEEQNYLNYVKERTKRFEEYLKRTKVLYGLTDPEDKKEFDAWLVKNELILATDIERHAEQKTLTIVKRKQGARNHLVDMRLISFQHFKDEKKLRTALLQGILYLGMVEAKMDGETTYLPIIALHDKDGKFLELEFSDIIKEGEKFIMKQHNEAT